MNKKLMIAMVVVGASALYMRFQIMGMEEDKRAVKRRKVELIEGGTQGFVGPRSDVPLKGILDAGPDRTGHIAALLPNLDRLPMEIQAEILSSLPFPPRMTQFLYSMLCFPKKLGTLRHDSSVYEVILSPDGNTLATLSARVPEGLRVILWNRSSRRLLYESPFDFSPVFSPDLKTLVMDIDDDGVIGIFEVPSMIRLKTLQGGRDIKPLACSRDGLLATAAGDIWNVDSGAIVQRLPFDPVASAATFSPDGKKLATIELGQRALIWNVENGMILQALMHNGIVSSVAFSSDGMKLATGSEDKTAGIWDVASGNRLQTLQHDSPVWAVAFSPDGKLLATGSRGSAIMWNVENGNKLRVLEDLAINSIAFSNDGTKLAMGCVNFEATVWDVSCFEKMDRLIHDLKTNYAWFELMRIFDLHLAGRPPIILDGRQKMIFETLPLLVKDILEPMIRKTR